MPIDDPRLRSEWLRDPARLRNRARKLKVNLLTAELAAWCAEIHRHLAELAEQRELPLLLMGGNAAALRLEVGKQRGSRDNDYLTTASEDDIEGLMAGFSDRFRDLAPDFTAAPYRPKEPRPGLALATYLIRVPLQLEHGYQPSPRLSASPAACPAAGRSRCALLLQRLPVVPDPRCRSSCVTSSGSRSP